jgi:hypothetical protein
MLTTPVIYITIPYSLLGDETQISCNHVNDVGVNVLIDQEEIDIKNIMDYVRKLDYYYIFSLSSAIINGAAFDNLLPKLYTLFTLSASFTKKNKSIPVFADTSTDQLMGLKKIKDYFFQQSEPDIELLRFDSDEIRAEKNILLAGLTHLKLFTEVQLEEYRSKEINQIIIPFKGVAHLKHEMELITSLSQDNRYTKLFFEMTTLRMNSCQLLYQSELWEKRAKLYLSFLSISKKIDKSQYYDLQQWYEREYEVLPVWYKRVGHIVKVLIGKRNFRSLFSDNVKKYKN